MPNTLSELDRRLLHGKVNAIGTDLTVGLGKVTRRFVIDALTGMLLSGSVRLTEIARALDETIPLHSTHKRMSRNLGNPHIGRVVADNLLAVASRAVRDEALLVIDLFELVKPYAEKMEYLASPPSSADARPPEPGGDRQRGYHVCEVFGWDVHGGPLPEYEDLARQLAGEYPDDAQVSAWNHQVVTPLAQTLFSSSAPDYQSETDEVLGLVRRVNDACGGRCLFAIDTVGLAPRASLHRQSPGLLAKQRGLPDALAAETGCRFAARIAGDYPLLYARQTTTAHDVGESCQTPYGETLYKHQADLDIGVFVHFGAVPVRLPATPDRPMWLLTVKRLTGDPRGPANDMDPYLILTTQPMPRNRKLLWNLAWSFLSYWDAIQTNQALKEQFDFDDVRVLTYDRLRNLGTLVLAASFVESRWPGIGLTTSLFAEPRGRSFRFYRSDAADEGPAGPAVD